MASEAPARIESPNAMKSRQADPRRAHRLAGLAAILAVALAVSLAAQQRFTVDLLDEIEFRNMGPFRAGAWITDFAVPATPERAHRNTIYVGTRNGGVWKTTNAGATFEPIFDDMRQQSIGAVAVAPSDQNQVWVGTGESFVVRYSYAGDGIYKSTDQGATWQHMGLRDTQHIARILIHPTDPDVVFVASMGPLHTRSPDRGVYRTRDGGRTWENVLFVDDQVGVIEMVMDPSDPDTLYAAMYDKERVAWRLEQGGPGSGIHKTTDGGTTWTRLESGLPTGNIGRIGLDVFRADPNVLYALVENLNPRPEGLPQPSPVGGGIGEVYRSDDAGMTWRLTHDRSINVGGKAPYSFNWLKVDPEDDQRVWATSVWVAHTTDGGRTWNDLEGGRTRFRNMFGDIRAIWVDPDDPERLLVGSDGGVYQTFDAGRTIKHYANLPLGEVYAVAVDMDDPYHVHAGLQDHESWRAPINGFAGHVGQELWVTVGMGDGMYNAVDPTDSRWVYNTQQFGGHYRQDVETGERTSIAPPRNSAAGPRYRYTWTTPLVLSPHDPKTLITGAQVVLCSRDQGETWEEISPDLTTGAGMTTNVAGNPCSIDRVGDGNVWYCTITTLAESAHTAGVLWAATDDGRIHVTRDDGGSWTDVTDAIGAAGAPEGYWFTRVTPSRAEAGRAYATITGFHRDDFRPLVYRTDDFGASWRAIAATLPDHAPANVIVEDHTNASLLFLGTDRGLFASVDTGATWTPFQANMPVVPVRDLVIHPRENDLVVGTHGRGAWIADVTPLQQMSEEVLAEPFHLFAPEPKGLRVESGWGNYRLYGDDVLMTPNEPNGLPIWFWQRDAAGGPATIRVTNAAGEVVYQTALEAGAGLRRAFWNLRVSAGGGRGGGRGAGRGGGGGRGGAEAAPGQYTVTLEAGGRTFTQPATVKPPVSLPRIAR
jgi:photosystem II stability/assembly factor-like uncharacterized protein